jgi:predicted GIY-YIG superfamily endonuclease
LLSQVIINNLKNDLAGTYRVECHNCDTIYIGETNNIKIRNKRHQYEFKKSFRNNSLVKHSKRFNPSHQFEFENTVLFKNIKNEKVRTGVEAYLIEKTRNNCNEYVGDIKLDKLSIGLLDRNKLCNKSLSLLLKSLHDNG